MNRILFFVINVILSANFAAGISAGEAAVRKAEQLSVLRFEHPPFDSLAWLRADLTGETIPAPAGYTAAMPYRPFTNYSGDVSGRFIEFAAVLKQHNAVLGKVTGENYEKLLGEIPKLQRPGGYFGSGKLDWEKTVIAENEFKTKYTPALWGNSRMLCGLIESYKAQPQQEILHAAEKLGDFYAGIAPQWTSPSFIARYVGSTPETVKDALQTGTPLPVKDSYAAAFGTCFFPAIEGLVKLYQLTKKKKYLDTAEQLAAFYRAFDLLRTSHIHGMLCSYYGILLLYETTGSPEYLQRAEKRWTDLVRAGIAAPTGGVPEGVNRHVDEGCAEADWLRVNLKLYQLTKNEKYRRMFHRLLNNHYLMNQWLSGGFGHRQILQDARGQFGFGKGHSEAVWCCDFHGALGLQYYSEAASRMEAIKNTDSKKLTIEKVTTEKLTIENRCFETVDAVKNPQQIVFSYQDKLFYAKGETVIWKIDLTTLKAEENGYKFLTVDGFHPQTKQKKLLTLTTMGSGSENETGVFVFDAAGTE
ncbi:MAG: glycoside hydrolase family 127 protein [Planctomycetaceae bacterium]|nr:glycoside hydrolase family 127 protein [Planctomycetaceae bacterium]